MDALVGVGSLLVRQQRELGEVLTGLERRNRYVVTDPVRGDLATVREEGGSTLGRILLRRLRPFLLRLHGLDDTVLLELRRPFRFYFHEVEVRDAHQRKLGSLRREFSLLRRVYAVRDAGGAAICRLYGPLMHPWTFEIRQGDRVTGRIVKKWGALATEAFTDTDTFGITFPAGCTPTAKAVLLSAVFLVDFVHFENRVG